MKKIKAITLLFVASLLIFSACKRSRNASMGAGLADDVALTYIPEAATNVNTMNIQSVMDKMDFEAVQKMDFYQSMLEDVKRDRPQVAFLFEDPNNSGIDLTKNIYMFSDVSEKGGKGVFIASVITLSDATKFGEMLEKVGSYGEFTITAKNGYKIAKLRNSEKMMVVWNDEMAVTGAGDALGIEDKVVNILTNKPKKSIVDNKSFRQNFKGGHDFYSYQNLGMVSSFMDEDSELMLEGLGLTKADLDNNTIISYGDFKNGAIEGHQEYNFSPKVKELMGAIMKPSVKTDFSAFIPGENLVVLGTSGLNLKGINTLINEQMGASVSADAGIQALGLTRNEIISAFDGDMFAAGYAVDDKSAPKMLIGLNINDKKLVDKILNVGIQQKMLKKNGEVYTLNSMVSSMAGLEAGFQLTVKSNVLLMGSGEVIAKVSKGNFEKVPSAKMKKLDDGAFGLFAEFETLSKLFPNLPFSKITDMVVSGGLNGTTSTVNLKDKNKNSLQVLMQMVEEMYEMDKSGMDKLMM